MIVFHTGGLMRVPAGEVLCKCNTDTIGCGAATVNVNIPHRGLLSGLLLTHVPAGDTKQTPLGCTLGQCLPLFISLTCKQESVLCAVVCELLV